MLCCTRVDPCERVKDMFRAWDLGLGFRAQDFGYFSAGVEVSSCRVSGRPGTIGF